MCAVKPWLAHYDSGVPHTLAPYPEETLLDYLGPLAREHGDKPALLFKGATFSYRELESQSDDSVKLTRTHEMDQPIRSSSNPYRLAGRTFWRAVRVCWRWANRWRDAAVAGEDVKGVRV